MTLSVQNVISQNQIEQIVTPKGHYYGSEILKDLIQSVDVSKVLVFKGTDSENEEHLIFKRFDSNNKMINKTYAVNNGLPCPGLPGCPEKPRTTGGGGNVGSLIDEGIAEQMISQYQANGNYTVASFSKSDLAQLLSQPNVKGVYFTSELPSFKGSFVAIAVDRFGGFIHTNHIKSAEIEMPYYVQVSTTK
ncbi:MAG: hypothetical protein EBR30_23980 [Cytophagia bacterium]|nr:hypothetical protein [Cytophagia bacterium]